MRWAAAWQCAVICWTHGATPDIFMASALGGAALATRLLDADPSCAGARVNEPGYAPVPPGHIYGWVLGFLVSPHEVALARGHRDVYDVLMRRSSAKVRFLPAASRGDEGAARQRSPEHPTSGRSSPSAITRNSPRRSTSAASPPAVDAGLVEQLIAHGVPMLAIGYWVIG